MLRSDYTIQSNWEVYVPVSWDLSPIQSRLRNSFESPVVFGVSTCNADVAYSMKLSTTLYDMEWLRTRCVDDGVTEDEIACFNDANLDV